MKIENQTPFAIERLAVCDADGKDLLLVLAKATYQFDEKGNTAISTEQIPVELADQYYGEPGKTSIKYASDFSFGKQSTDVTLCGNAISPKGKSTEIDVSLEIGKIKKTVKVFGDRYWKNSIAFVTKSSPEPFEKIPIKYELAFGGVDTSNSDPEKHDYEKRNSVGVGFRAKRSQIIIDNSKLPNIEDPRKLISNPDDKPTPAGFGFIAPYWQPRLSYAGTYDDNWKKTRMPLLPGDFDFRFFNTAPQELVSEGFLKGDEKVKFTGASNKGTINFSLPGVKPQSKLYMKNTEEIEIILNLDRVFIDAEINSFILLWSGGLVIKEGFQDVETINCTLK